MTSLSRLSVFSFLLSACAPVAPSAVETEPGRPPLAPVRLAGGSDAPTVETWWVSGAARVEQGWTLSAGSGPRQRLELDLLEGAEAHRAPLGVVIEEADGRVWQVSDARAWDARGEPLPAVLSVTDAGLAVEVDTAGAEWPVTVDPVYASYVWSMTGASTYSGMGASLAAGDLNGDGYRDLVVGGYYAGGSTGRVEIFYGSAAGVSATAGTSLVGAASGDLFGWAVAVVEDLNGDAADELVVGAPGYGADVGAIYLYLGASGGIGSASQTITGPASFTRFGAALADVGDTNGDAKPDLLVGAYSTSSNTGAAYLYTGSSAGLSTSAAVSFAAPSAGAYFGESLAGAGDVNNDSFNDVIIGSRGTGGGAGSAQVYLGSAAGVSTTAAWSVSGAAGEYLGTGVGGAGDVNNDGYDDVIVGAVGVASYTGEALIFHGSATGPATSASTTLSGTAASSYFGQVVTGVGDVDGDGYDDVAVAAVNEDSYDGAVYVFEGGSGGVGTTAVRTIPGATDSRFGTALVGAGDVDASGHADLLAGGVSWSTWTGRAQLHLGYDDTDADGDGSTADLDCDDGDASAYPGAPELCDLKDNDCDNQTDETGASGEREFFLDVDGDTFGVETSSTIACFAAAGYAEVAGDCNDGDAAIHPDATEVCDSAGTDEDCDELVDDDDGSTTGKSTFYLDADTDGYGDAAADYCAPPSGYTSVAGDCNDSDAAINPNASEVCDAADTDENCDGWADDDDAFATGKSTFYEDADGDGHGDVAADYCDLPDGYATDAGDCNDADAAVHPGGTERCDAADVDEDCDGAADDADGSATDKSTFYLDSDTDGYGSVAADYCDLPAGYSAVAGDCNDAVAAINPNASEVCDGDDNNCDGAVDESGAIGEGTWYADADGDGFGDPGVAVESCAVPSGYLADDSDCDDTDPAINELATEVCDGVDNNCDAQVDEAGAADEPFWYADTDGDGYGSDATAVKVCEAPAGHVAEGGDCNDADSAVHPSATERCDAADVDEDCDGAADDSGASGESTWYPDYDGDTFGTTSAAVLACNAPASHVGVGGDCNDAVAVAHPGAAEVCDGDDNDCDGVADESGAAGEGTWYADADGDGFGDPAAPVRSCVVPSGYLADESDCDDTDPAINELALEVCDGADNDCDEEVDEAGALDEPTWYADTDGDGYGSASSTVTGCAAPSGYAAAAGDCDEGDADVFPGAPESDCSDPTDYNCDGSSAYTDDDGDGSPACEDCNDADSAVHPSATELCDAADVDEDCDGAADGSDASGASTWYADYDGDSFGSTSSAVLACDAPDAHVSVDGDCNDAVAASYPGATEVCDGDDNNCDGVVDEPGATGEGTWYADADGDGFGDPGVAVESCAVPSGYLADDSDCDDTDPTINALATEVCDGVDNNCDAQVDEAGAADEPFWYADTDGDGYGSDATAVRVCEPPPGHVAEGGDCNEGDADVFPGAPETDCDDPVDYNCDGSSAYADLDADGAPACEDCNDADAQIGPEVTETCNDVDDDCDGRVDADAVDASEWYPDGDGDGYTLGDGAVRECDPPPGMSALSSPLDCDDEDGAIYPGAPELAGDDVDQDCDGADTELEDTGPDDKDQAGDIPDPADTGAAAATGCAHSPRPGALGWLMVLVAGLALRRAR